MTGGGTSASSKITQGKVLQPFFMADWSDGRGKTTRGLLGDSGNRRNLVKLQLRASKQRLSTAARVRRERCGKEQEAERRHSYTPERRWQSAVV